jgi:hypothetical protein
MMIHSFSSPSVVHQWMGSGFIVTTNKRMHFVTHSRPAANCAARKFLKIATRKFLKIADRVSHARSMVFLRYFLSLLMTEKSYASPMHRCVAGQDDNVAARPDGKKSFMVHGPKDVKTKPLLCHIDTVAPLPTHHLKCFLVLAEHYPHPSKKVLRTCADACPNKRFSPFFVGLSHKNTFFNAEELKAAPASV